MEFSPESDFMRPHCVCMHTPSEQLCAHTYVHTHLWRSKDTWGVVFEMWFTLWVLFILFWGFWDSTSHWTEICLIYLGCLTVEIQGSSTGLTTSLTFDMNFEGSNWAIFLTRSHLENRDLMFLFQWLCSVFATAVKEAIRRNAYCSLCSVALCLCFLLEGQLQLP